MKEKFISWRPHKLSVRVLEASIQILDQYARDNYRLTLRQLYYQLVARDFLPQEWADKETGSTNNKRSYANLGGIIKNARLAGLIDWNAIEDRVRHIQLPTIWTDINDILDSASRSFSVDTWAEQESFVFCMAEKDAVSNIIVPECERYRVPFLANRGYVSTSTIKQVRDYLSYRLSEFGTLGAYCIYFGDHDPSGLDMDRDIQDRLELMLGSMSRDVTVSRIALTMSQIEEFDPPPDPAKVTDTRYKKYVSDHGEQCWELDAIEPNDLSEIVRSEIEKYIDTDLFDESVDREEEHQERIQRFVSGWNDWNKQND